MDSQEKDKVTVVQTDIDNKDGQTKCPKCGSTDISPQSNGKLRCNFCRHEFEQEKIKGMVDDLKSLEGKVIASGAGDIIADTKDVVTIKCESCGAEVVIDTASVTQARCHWCRNTLSINKQIPNGSIPDVVLPFSIDKKTAQIEIDKFVKKRNFFAHPKFKKEFTTDNIMGVYFPYMIVDANGHSTYIGEGEHQIRSYSVGSGDDKETRYDADLYHVERDFDIIINGLSVESSLDKLDTKSKNKTTNIINSIMPFDVENCVKYDANYLRGYTSEKRDTNISQLEPLVKTQLEDISRFAANDTLEFVCSNSKNKKFNGKNIRYDRGVKWTTQTVNIKGEQWKAAYLPVWLYSYQQKKGNKSLLHYVAVNARTKETMGSVPIHMPKLIFTSLIIEILSGFAMTKIEFDNNWILLSVGVIFFIIMYTRYRNSNARHTYELETKKEISNLKKVDNFIKTKTGLSNSTMSGANNRSVNGQSMSSKILSSITAQGMAKTALNSLTDDNAISNKIDEMKK